MPPKSGKKAGSSKKNEKKEKSGVDVMAELEAEEAEHRKRAAAKKAVTKAILDEQARHDKTETGKEDIFLTFPP
jgi:hypothetical protein